VRLKECPRIDARIENRDVSAEQRPASDACDEKSGREPKF
jgi:hypothetical protein